MKTTELTTTGQSLALGFSLVLLVMAGFWVANGLLPSILRWYRRDKKCKANVIVGYATHSEVELWMCGDKVCRCGGTKVRGYLDGR